MDADAARPALIAPIADAFRAACAAELDALKPGNVHRFADGHGMSVAQFEASASAAAPAIAHAGASVGTRILAATQATWNAVGCNTNLGIVLLCAPLARAAENLGIGQTPDDALAHDKEIERPDAKALAAATRAVLEALTVDDAVLAYRAITLAHPGGLGRVEHADVHDAPRITLRAAMALAAPRDRIAFQYVHGVADIFDRGLPLLREYLARSVPLESATTALYLGLLADAPDSHVLRKFGDSVAHSVTNTARTLRTRFVDAYASADARSALIDWDTHLKSQGINPGTTADLTVATLFVHLLADG